jgi:hypothetical protein
MPVSWRKTLSQLWPLALIGIVLLLIGNVLGGAHLTDLPAVLLRDVGVGVMVAFVLAVTIDRMFRQEALTDITRAALGYLLPDPLRDEMLWIYAQKLVCFEHRLDCQLRREGDTARVYVKIHRVIRNVTDGSQRVNIGQVIDEWGFPGHPSIIDKLAFRLENQNWVTIENRTLQPHTVSAGGASIDLPAGRSIELESSYEVTKRLNDEYSEIFATPTLHPEVTVCADGSLRYFVGFSHRNQDQVYASPDGWYRLPGTLLPLQRIVIRWYPVDITDTSSEHDEVGSGLLRYPLIGPLVRHIHNLRRENP